MKKYDIALIGLGVMGQSLARNMANQKFRVLTFNRSTETAKKFIAEYGAPHLDYRKTLKALARDLKSPRKIIIMVKAGEAVDMVIKNLSPHLSRGDIIIDAGNSLYKDSQSRYGELKKKGFRFVGMGVSGGEEGALKGPSIMPGCDAGTWTRIAPMLRKIAAKDFAGGPCVTRVGADGAGHYVKMIHNGIEYGIMQMMAEAYHMFHDIYGLSAHEISVIFRKYNKGKLKSFLFEIAVPVLREKNEFGEGYLIDYILDKAGQKGTGRWTAIDALEHGVVLPTITEAVYARSASSLKEQRVELSKLYKRGKKKPALSLAEFIRQMEGALYAGILSSYAQGFGQIQMAAAENNWKINFAEVARVWEGGCIIRAHLLNFLHKAFRSAGGKAIHLFTIQDVRKALRTHLPAWRQIVSCGALYGIPLPALASSLAYFESMTTARLPANFIQGLRDHFGAHTYQRVDRSGIFHTQWPDSQK